MPDSANDIDSFPPRIALLLPVVLLFHQAEEWFGGFPEWTRLLAGNEVSSERFILINAVGLFLITFWTLAAFREPRMAWIVASVATILGLNGVLHALASVLLGRYSPGTTTGVLLSLPLSVIVLRASVAGLPRAQVFGAVLAGVLLHGVVTYLALV
jgi:hypothetical protein